MSKNSIVICSFFSTAIYETYQDSSYSCYERYESYLCGCMSNTLIEKTDKNCKRIRVQKRLLLISLFMMSFAGVLYGNSKATATRVYADAADGTQIPTLGISGALETFFGTSGSLNVDAQLSGGQARALQVLSDGTCLVALSKSAVDCVVAKYSSIGTLETSTFGSSGVADLGSSTVVAHAMMLDTQNRCLVAGGDDTTSGSAGWLKRVSTDGNSITSFRKRSTAY